jgi:hypothetical protein
MPPKGRWTPCVEDGCDGRALARRLCSKHYQRHKKQGTLPPSKSLCCKIDGCDGIHEGLGYCRNHYRAFKKHGDPLVKAVSSTQLTSESVKKMWDDPEYKAKMAVVNSGANNKMYKGAKVKRDCAICGESFASYPNYNGVERRYCSRECAYRCPERIEKLRKSSTGKKASPQTRKKLSESHIGLMCGENSPSWKGGISKIGQKLRASMEYRRWRQAVFVRDDYTCQICGKRGVPLQADHHPYPFSKYPDRRLDVENGRALCKPCHHRVTYVTKEWCSA